MARQTAVLSQPTKAQKLADETQQQLQQVSLLIQQLTNVVERLDRASDAMIQKLESEQRLHEDSAKGIE